MNTPSKPLVVPKSSPDVVTHVYRREIQAQSDDSLSKIAALISPGSTVLDVGTGSGALGQHLKAAGGYTVDGVTYNAEEAALAQPHYRNVQTLDLEQQSLGSAVGENRYDVIVCADVLEHLRNAGTVLQSMTALLNPGGRVLISLPNVTHLGVLLGLMAGRFVRTKEGLLDSTHVHFLDRVGLNQLVKEAGFGVVIEDAVVRNLIDTEFAALNYQALPKAVRSFVASLPDSDIYQFVWALQPLADTKQQAAHLLPVETPAIPVIEQVPHFRAQLFLDRGHGFKEDDCIDAYGTQANTLQVLAFDIVEGGTVCAVRLDLADRPGQIEFLHLRALDAAGGVLWTWCGDWGSNLVYHQTDWTGARGGLGGRVVRLTGDDPWVQIPLDNKAWLTVNRVELCISGPQPISNSDYPGVDAAHIQAALQLLSQQAATRLEQLELQLENVRSLADFRQSDIETLREELQAAKGLADFRQSDIDTLREELQAAKGLADFRQSDIETLRKELQAAQGLADFRQSDIDTLREELQAAKALAETTQASLDRLNARYLLGIDEIQRLGTLAAQLDAVHDSFSWRVTKGPRWLSAKVKQYVAKDKHGE